MFDTLKRLYMSGKLTSTGLDNAVIKGWLTTEQADTIRTEVVA